jgi:uncharacterized protein YbjT (DUF2867 family)
MMERVLVTGATGKIGSFLVPRLATQNKINVRVFGRSIESLSAFKAQKVEFARGTFERAAQVRSAVRDVDTIVLITSANPNAARQVESVLQAALEMRVRKIIRVSVFKATTDGPTFVTKLHGQTDELIQNSGIAYTILRPGFFMQNLLFLAAQTIVAEDRVYFGSGGGKFALIDLRDIADCIEHIIDSGSCDNEILTLTGPESISFQDIADRLTAILERPIDYIRIAPEKVQKMIEAKGLGNWYAAVMRQLCEQYARNWGFITTTNVERITGHPARSFETFAQEILVPHLKSLQKSEKE